MHNKKEKGKCQVVYFMVTAQSLFNALANMAERGSHKIFQHSLNTSAHGLVKLPMECIHRHWCHGGRKERWYIMPDSCSYQTLRPVCHQKVVWIAFPSRFTCLFVSFLNAVVWLHTRKPTYEDE